MPVTDISYSTQNSKTESISHIINKFETCTFNKDSNSLDEKDPDQPPRPTTAPPALPPNTRSVVQRKDELISKLCEEVCYLNTQIIELNHCTPPQSEPVKYLDEIEKRKPGLFEDNYFIISGSVSPSDEVAANISTLSEKKHLADSKQLLSSVTNGGPSPVRSMVTHYNQQQLAEFGANELNTSPKVSNLSGSSHFNVCSDPQWINTLPQPGQEEDRAGPGDELWIKQSVTSLEGNASPDEEGSIEKSDSVDSLDLDSECFNFSSESSTPQNSRGLQRFNGFENLEDLLKAEKLDSRVSTSSPDLRECVAKCDWSTESPRTMHSLTFDEMAEWNLSNSDLAEASRALDSDSDSEADIPDTYGNDEVNGIDTLRHDIINGDIFRNEEALLNGINGYHQEEPSLRQALQRTQAQCDRTMKEFNKMRSYLDNVTDEVYAVPLLATSHLACSQELLDNDSVQSSRRHSVAESPWGNFNNFMEGRQTFSKSLNNDKPQNGRLKKTKSGIRYLEENGTRHENGGRTLREEINGRREEINGRSSREENGGYRDEQVRMLGETLSIRELVREVCADEAMSETAKLRQQLKERDAEIEHLHAENDDLCDSIRHLEAKVDEKCEQQAKLQSLNRSLQAQNFTLSTNLSHKDLSVEKLKKYLNKGPPSRTSSSCPLTSIPEVLPNTAHKYGFLNRSSQSISRRKSLRPWKRRLCVLDQAHLSVYKVENVETFITVASIIDVKHDEQRAFGKNVIMVECDDGREHFLQANSKDDMLEWISRIGALIQID